MAVGVGQQADLLSSRLWMLAFRGRGGVQRTSGPQQSRVGRREAE